ncbi:MAG: hypothetical protein K2M89_04135 [Clostridiales bacterium]|nr:hypothetical protein [Clostridiales bacterium]
MKLFRSLTAAAINGFSLATTGSEIERLKELVEINDKEKPPIIPNNTNGAEQIRQPLLRHL